MRSTRTILYIYVFFLALCEALLFSINSPFIRNIVGDDLVGTVYSIASLAALLILLYLPRALKRSGAMGSLSVLLIAGSAGAIGVALSHLPYLLGFLVIFLAIPQVAPAISDAYIGGKSKRGERGSAIGAEFTWMNLANLIGPLVGGFVVARAGFSSLYVVSGVIFIVALMAATFFLPEAQKVKREHGNYLDGVKTVWKNKNLRHALGVIFLLQFFFAWMIIYTPIYLVGKFQFSFSTLGIIFTFMLLPYILLEYPLGKIADSKLGEKELLICGFMLMAVTVGVIPFIGSASPLVWAVILFGTRLGSATVESMSAVYFFKIAKPGDSDAAALFRDMRPFAYLIAPLLASLVIEQLSVAALFPILAGIMIVGALYSTSIRDTL